MGSQQVIIWGVIAVYAFFMLAVGIIFSGMTKGKGMDNFTVGGRNAGAWISALSYGTAYFSAVMFIGYSGKSGWNFGLWAVWIGIGNALFGTLLAWLVLANRTREVTRRMEIKSMPQFFEKRYQSKNMKLFSSIVIFIFLLPYSASVYKGLTSVCSVLLNIDETVCMIIIAAVAATVLILGGYMATLRADFVQGLIMFFGVILLIVMVSNSDMVGGFSAGISKMSEYMRNDTEMPINAAPKFGYLGLVSTIIMTSFGTWGLPQMIHKYYAIRDKKEVVRGVVISTIFALLVAGGGYYIGSLSHLFFGSELPAGGVDYIVPNMLKISGISDVVIGLVLVLLIAASVSTLASITLTAASTVSMDLVKHYRAKISDANLTTLTKVLCLLFVIASYFVANSKTPILDMMSYSWGIIAGSFLAPYVLALYMKGINRTGAWVGILSGFTIAAMPVIAKLFANDWLAPFGMGKMMDQGPQFACAAIVVSLIFCIAGSALASSLKLKGSERNELFYQTN